MTDGTSQGLFIVVAIVIFGIFVVLAYILFEDTLSPSMNGLFGDSIEMTNMNINAVKYYGESGIRPNPASDFDFVDNGDGTVTLTKYLSTSDTSLVIPWEIEGKPVTIVGDNLFWGNPSMQLESVKFPNTVVSIGQNAFWGNKIKSVLLQDSIETIGDGAFYQNILDRLIVPNGVVNIGDKAFSNNKLLEVKLPKSATNVHSTAFDGNLAGFTLK